MCGRGQGPGKARAPTPGQAHELALKGAETDATKRALATFGNPFGLALYDREQRGVRKTRGASRSSGETLQIGPWVLRSSTGKPVSSHDTAKSFVEALKQAMSEAHDIELLYDVWEQNIETLRVLHRSTNERPRIVPTMVSHLRACAVGLVKRASNASANPVAKGNGCTRHKIDKSVLTISEPKRIRCKEHLSFVASQPCLICGRSPSYAHHIRYAQPRGISLKVSDEFTVPLCATHHHQIHTTGKEREWWHEHNIDPLKTADALWQQSRERDLSPTRADALEDDALRDREAEPIQQASPASDASFAAVPEPSSVTSRKD